MKYVVEFSTLRDFGVFFILFFWGGGICNPLLSSSCILSHFITSSL